MAELRDLYRIIINWVDDRQRDGILSKMWGSAQSYSGDQIIALHRNGMSARRTGPYIMVYDTHYEVHQLIHARYGWSEVVGRCNAADPKFFDTLLDDMIKIQTADDLASDSSYGQYI
jgi:hypothetical protein